MGGYFNKGDDGELKISKFNAGIPALYRLDELRKDAHRHSREISYVKWNEDLDRYWIELAADANKDHKDQMVEIDKKLINSFLYANGYLLKQSNLKLYGKIIRLQKSLLMQKEEILARLQNTQGKGTAYMDPDEDDFE